MDIETELFQPVTEENMVAEENKQPDHQERAPSLKRSSTLVRLS
jgi:hypothetical protein